jgi:hypothetical protein
MMVTVVIDLDLRDGESDFWLTGRASTANWYEQLVLQ